MLVYSNIFMGEICFFVVQTILQKKGFSQKKFVQASDLDYISLLSDIFLFPFQINFLFLLVDVFHVQVPLGAQFLRGDIHQGGFPVLEAPHTRVLRRISLLIRSRMLFVWICASVHE